MRSALGNDWNAFESIHQQPSPVTIRINPEKYNASQPLEVVPWSTYGKYLNERPVFTLDPTFHAGAYYVQEASSMFLEQAFIQTVNTAQPLQVLDLCAAPGGKSTHLLSLINKDSLIVSNEVIRARSSILAENIQKWGSNNVVVTNNDPEDFQRLGGFFDVIVVDAPCSGEGLFRKDPGAMKEWSDENVLLCSKRQQRILADIWPTLKENGILIYSTCTYNPTENEENLKWLTTEHGVEFLSLKLEPEWNIETVAQNGIIGYHFYPHRVQGEGFFISVLRKKEAHQERKKGNLKNTFLSPSKKIQEKVSNWIKHPEEKTFIQRGDLLQFFPSRHLYAIEFLSRNLHLVSAGTFLATVKHDKLIPEHVAALSTELADGFLKIEVSLEEALQYLRKEPLTIPIGQKGFSLIVHNNLPLGWVNVLDNRMNNLYPSNWRIRM